MRIIATIFPLLFVCVLSAQVNNIYRSGGISQTVGAPTFKPGASGNIVAIDTVTGIWYISRDRYSVNWLSMGYRIENISGCSAPAYIPNKMNSTLVINNCLPPEMYAYNGATWEQIAGGGGGGGLTTEQVQDIVAAMLVDGDGITTGYSDVDGLITVTNTGDLSATNELNTAFSVTSGNLRITDAGGNKDVAVTSVAPIQSLVSGTGISVTGAGSAKTITSTITQADGSETKVNAGIGISVSGIGTTGSPYVIASTTTGTTDLSFSGTSSPVTLNISTGTDVTITAGTGIGLAATSGNMTVTNSAPDQTVSITGAGITAITGTYPNFTVMGTEVDGSTSNEGALSVTAGSGTTSVIHSNTSGASDVTLTASTGLSISENTGTGVITLTNSSPDQTVTLSSGAGISVTGTYPNFTVASTITQYTDENAQDAVGAMIGNTLTYVDATPLLDVKTQMSITSDASGVKLSGDASTPGATMLYGTNGSGTKGWYAQPSGGGGGASSLGYGFVNSGGDGLIPGNTSATVGGADSTFQLRYYNGIPAIEMGGPIGTGGVNLYSLNQGTAVGLRDEGITFSNNDINFTLADATGFQINTSSSAFYPPRMATTDRDAIVSPAEGAIVINNTTHAPNFHNGTAWKVLEPLPTLGTSLQQIRVNSGGTALEYFTPSSLGITDLTGDVTATGPGSVAATISSFAVTTPKIAPNAVDGTKISMSGDVTGDIMVYDGTDYVRLAAGSTGNVLTSNGAATLPSWAAGGGGGGGASVITPTLLSSDQDDYSPTGWATATHVRISGGSSIFAITSFAATSDGDTKHLINIGSYPMYFPSEHPDGTAANRILGYGCDFILYPGCAVDIMYDGTSSRWRIMGGEAPQQYSRVLFYNYTAGAAASGEQISTGAINSGSISGSNSAASNIPAAAVISSLTTTNGGGVYYFTRTSVQFGAMGSSHILFTSFISLPTLSDATNTYTFASQVTSGVNNSTINQNNAIGIRYSDGINSGKWEGYSRDNSGAESTVDLGITVSAATTYLLTTELDASRTEARFYVNGVMAGRVTGNMPNATGCGGRVILVKSAGTTARTAYIHRMSAMAIYP